MLTICMNNILTGLVHGNLPEIEIAKSYVLRMNQQDDELEYQIF